MSNEQIVFNSRFVGASRTKHQCMGCKHEIPVGYSYVRYPSVSSSGKFVCMNLCVGCAYLWLRKTGEHQEYLNEGEFSEQKIPNFLRKQREIFEKNPVNSVRERGIMFFGKHENPVHDVVVSSEELNRNLLYFRKKRYTESQFVSGAGITLRAGVNGKQREVRVVKSKKIDGKIIGKRGNFIAVLVK